LAGGGHFGARSHNHVGQVHGSHMSDGLPPNKAVNTDAQVRPLPSVAPVLVRRLPLR
jgi:hypothetical protein